ncbi:MAG: PLDc N-terminal domain-containing protein [Halioglobus sp.]
MSGFLGFIILVADIWAILNIVQSSASMGKKLVWILVVLLLPIIGLIIWWLAGPRGR